MDETEKDRKDPGAQVRGDAQAGSEKEDPTRTPGDGTLKGATPAGLTVKELLERAESPEQTNDTGTG
jgi:hypothetical protein